MEGQGTFRESLREHRAHSTAASHSLKQRRPTLVHPVLRSDLPQSAPGDSPRRIDRASTREGRAPHRLGNLELTTRVMERPLNPTTSGVICIGSTLICHYKTANVCCQTVTRLSLSSATTTIGKNWCAG